MKESDIKTSMVRSVLQAGGYARRIEDKFAVGTLDCIFIPPQLPVIFAEVKIVKGQTFGPSDRQYVELLHINRANSRHAFGIIIGWKDGITYFHETASSVKLTDCFSITDGTNPPFVEQLIQFYHGRLKI